MTISVRYTVLLEKSPRRYAAYAPDLLGCIAPPDPVE